MIPQPNVPTRQTRGYHEDMGRVGPAEVEFCAGIKCKRLAEMADLEVRRIFGEVFAGLLELAGSDPRVVVALLFLGAGYSYGEVAERLKVSRPLVFKWVQRARLSNQRLVDELTREGRLRAKL